MHAQHNDAGHKGPKEDCVEECKFPSFLSALHYEVMGLLWTVGTADSMVVFVLLERARRNMWDIFC